MKKLTILYAIMFLFGCQTTTEMTNNFDNSTAIDNTKSSQTPIVGGVETLYIHPFDISSFQRFILTCQKELFLL